MILAGKYGEIEGEIKNQILKRDLILESWRRKNLILAQKLSELAWEIKNQIFDRNLILDFLWGSGYIVTHIPRFVRVALLGVATCRLRATKAWSPPVAAMWPLEIVAKSWWLKDDPSTTTTFPQFQAATLWQQVGTKSWLLVAWPVVGPQGSTLIRL